nr:hypothetical protein [uncultured Dyadobacter sp.]
MKSITKLLLCCCLVSGLCQAAPGTKAKRLANEPCFRQLKALFDRQIKLNTTLGNETRYVHYTVLATTGGATPKTYESEVKVYVNKHGTYLESKDLELYQDEKVLVSVLPGRKMIFIQQPPADRRKWQMERLRQVGILQDSLFEYAQLTDCALRISADGNKDQHVRIGLSKDGVRHFKIRSIDFVMDEKAAKMKGFTIEYDPQHRLKTLQCVFKDIDYSHSGGKLSKPALASVLTREEVLLPRFKDFKLIDNRKKKQ